MATQTQESLLAEIAALKARQTPPPVKPTTETAPAARVGKLSKEERVRMNMARSPMPAIGSTGTVRVNGGFVNAGGRPYLTVTIELPEGTYVLAGNVQG